MQLGSIININTQGAAEKQYTGTGLPFSDIMPGENVKAEVIGVSGNRVTLKAADGSVVDAEFPAGNMVREGDVVELTMADKGRNTVFLRLSAVNGQPVAMDANDTQVFLMRMGVPPSALNENAAQLLAGLHIKPTPQKMAALVEIASRFPELPSSIAAFFADNQIPATQENVSVIMKWVADPASLGRDIDSLKGMLVSEQGVTMEYIPAQGSVTSEGVKTGGLTAKLETQQYGQLFAKESLESEGSVLRNVVSQASLAELGSKLAGVDKAAARQAIMIFVQELGLSAEAGKNAETVLFAAYTATNSEMELEGQLQTGQPMMSDQAFEANKQPSGPLSAEGNAQINMAKTGEEIKQVLHALEKFFSPIKNGTANEVKTLEETVKNQLNLAQTVKEGVTRITGEQSPAAQKATDLTLQTRLGGQIDNFYYCQVPIDTSGGKNTAELYVFEKNRGTTLNEKENVTILVALDTQYMGRVETVLRAQNEQLSVEFRVENGEVGDYLQESADAFAEEMSQGGFSIQSIDVRMIKEAVTPLNAMEILNQAPALDLRGIDIRI